MKKHIIIGIDFSITSPAVTILTPERTEIWSVLKNKEASKIENIESPKFYQLCGPNEISASEWGDSYVKREMCIANKISTAIQETCAEWLDYGFPNIFIAIEGYSFGSKHTFAHKIGEATGCLIAALFYELPSSVKFFRPSPPEVKKSVGAKQKDGKQGVYDAFSERFNVNLMEVMEKKKLAGPITDICDSWACSVWMQNYIDSLNQTEN